MRFRLAAVVAVLLLCTTPGAAGTHPPRIVSLIPSLTEDLFAIGAGAQVVGTSQATDYPPAAARLPQVSSASSIDAEKVLSLHPDVVVGIPSQTNMVTDVRRLGLRVVLISDDSFDDIFTDLETLGKLSGREAQAGALIKRLRAKTAELVKGVPTGTKPRVFVVLGVAPIFTVGDRSYIAHLIGLAGGRNAASDLHDAYARYSAEALLALQPDVLVADHTSGIASALATEPWSSLHAVRAHRIYVLADAAILERPGPRYNDGLAWLIAHLHGHGT